MTGSYYLYANDTEYAQNVGVQTMCSSSFVIYSSFQYDIYKYSHIWFRTYGNMYPLCVCMLAYFPFQFPFPISLAWAETTGPHRWGPDQINKDMKEAEKKSHWHGQVLRSVHLAMYKVGLLPDTWAMMSPLCPCLCPTDNLSCWCCYMLVFFGCFVSRGSCRTHLKWR